jgi:hypothetical protein
MKNSDFWDITPYSPLKADRYFWGIRCFHHQSRRINQTRNQHKTWVERISLYLSWHRLDALYSYVHNFSSHLYCFVCCGNLPSPPVLFPLWSIGLISQFLDNFTDGRTPWTGDQLVARPLPTHRTNAHRHSCLEWDSKPRSQCSSGRRRFILRRRGHYDRPIVYSLHQILLNEGMWDKKEKDYAPMRCEMGTELRRWTPDTRDSLVNIGL